MKQPVVETRPQTCSSASPINIETAAEQSAGSSARGSRFAQFLPFGFVVAYWLINLLVISPAGNFPLNDDWIYSESVDHLLRTGQFHLLGCSPACVLHVVLGAVACLPAGFSHEHLRLLTNVMALLTSFMLYVTAINLGMERRLAALTSLVLLANPLVVNLSFSFMTDVPALLFSAIFAWSMLAAQRKNSPALAAVAGLALCAAILVRQTFAVFVVPSLLMAVIPAERKDWKLRATMIAVGVVPPILAALFAEKLMLRGNEFAAVYDWYKAQFGNVVHQLLFSPLVGCAGMVERTFKVFCYFALFCLPLIPFILKQIIDEVRTRQKAMFLSLSLAILVSVPSFLHAVVFNHQLLPFSNNLWRMPMVGPINLMGICVAGLKTRQRMYLTIAASILAVVLLTAIIRALIATVSLWQAKQPLFISAFAATAIGLVALQTGVLDYERYYLTALPAVLLLLSLWPLKANGRLVWASSIVLLAGLACYSTLATQDYLSWNRARFEAIRELTDAGVKPTEIDGGPEYNNLVNPELVRACKLSKSGYAIIHCGAPPMCNWRWWSVNGEKYIISFNTIPGYDVVAKHPFFGGLTFSTREIFTMKQNP
jgi:Dolichyl-phosphate-mannose-protein mannosyltransferase